jgi:Ca2+-binding RTX toxin-like protein
MVSLRNDLGGSAGFGEGSLPRGELIGSTEIDLGAFYNASAGLKFLGGFYTDLRIYSSGLIQFNPTTVARQDLPSYYGNFGGFGAAIAPFWSPVDTARSALAPSPGGTSTGSNLVWYDLDEVTGRLVVTWDDVRLRLGGGDEIDGGPGVNAFQMELTPASGPGATSIDFDVTFRYEHLGLTNFETRLANFTYAGSVAKAIFQDGSTRFAGADVQYELPPSVAADADRDNLDPDALQGLITDSNVGEAGVWRFAFRQGWLTPEVTVEDVTVTEGTGPGATFAPVTVRLEAGVPQAVTLTWQAIADTGNPATDLLAASGSVTFAPWETVRTIQVPINRDAIEEGTETLTLRLSGQPLAFLTPGGVVMVDRDATITILDDEGFRISDARALERDGTILFTVTRSSGVAPATVSYETVAGSAKAGADFTAATGTVEFGLGETSRQIAITLRDDAVAEGEESFTLRLTGSTDTGITDGEAIGIIGNDDGIVVDDVWVGTGETGPTPVIVPIRVVQPLAEAITLNWHISPLQDGNPVSVAFEGPSSGSITLPAGSDGSSIALLARPNQIHAYTLHLTDPSGASLLDGTALVTPEIMWSPTAPRISIVEGDPGSVIEALFRLVRKTEGLPETTVDWQILPDVWLGWDYTGPQSGQILFAEGAEVAELRLPLTSDALFDGLVTERRDVEFTSPSFGGKRPTASVVFEEDDGFGAAALTLGEDAGVARFQVERSRISLFQESISWEAIPAPGITGSSLGLTSGIITFAAGSRTAMLDIPLINDGIAEPNERYTIQFGSLTDPRPTLLTILDDDGGPPTISATERVAGEPGTGSALRFITLHLDKPSTETVRVAWDTADLAAKAGVDYVAASGIAEFAPGETTTTIGISILADDRREIEESFLIRFSNPENAVLAQGSVAFTIVHEAPAWSLESVTSALENGAGHYFDIRRTGDDSRPASIAWVLEATGANPVDANDFLHGQLPAGVAHFSAGQSVARIALPVAPDLLGEANEGFTIRLSDASDGGSITTAARPGVIVNDDAGRAVFGFGSPTLSLSEGDAGFTFFRFDVTRAGNFTGTERLQWSVVLPGGPDAATAADFADVIRPRDLVFRPGESMQQVTVRVAGDRAVEGHERFEVRLLNPSGTALIDAAAGSATGIILNDDSRLFALPSAPQPEGDGISGATHVIGLTRTDPLGTEQSVGWFIPVAQRAWLAAGQPFEGVARFGADEAYTSISINTRGDALSQPDRNIVVTLQPDAGFKSAPTAVALRILDDDQLLSIRARSADKVEGAAGQATPFTFLITREGVAGQAVDVAWQMLPGFPWPAESSDFSGPTSGVVTLGVGVRQMELTLNVAGDETPEDWEDFFVEITSLSPLAMVAPTGGIAVGRIRDDDGAFRRGSSDSDILTGLDVADRIDGGPGNDTIAGAGGNDLLRGDFGLDLLRGGLGADTLEGGGDNDTLFGGQGDDVLEGGQGVDNLNGEEGQDLLLGGADADVLRGDAGDDTLEGGAGNDTLIGGLGADQMEGGLGADRFAIFSLADAQGDIILDFNPAQLDRLDLSRLDANAGMAGDQAFAWIGNAAFGGVAGQLRFANEVLQGDVTGDGVADFQIGLTGVFSLSAAAIWL